MALRWQQSIVRWVNDGDLHEARWVLAALAIFLAGLALMFVAMQPARAEERSSVALRRLLYGTNAVLTGLLVLLLLAVVNVIVFLKLPENVVTTAAGFKGLSDTSKEFLQTIKEPVKVYLIMPQDYVARIGQDRYTSLYADCKSLLDAVESENKNVKAYLFVPRDRRRRDQADDEPLQDSRRASRTVRFAYRLRRQRDLSEFIRRTNCSTFMTVSIAIRGTRFSYRPSRAKTG